MTPQADKQLNCVRMFCPMPVIKTKVELEKLQVGQILEIIADDPAAELDLPSLAKSTGQEVVAVEKTDKDIHVFIKKIK
ncbi:sulfurtransferase TusA family protein [Thermoproteota archaeon]